jgi:hypothetical protein
MSHQMSRGGVCGRPDGHTGQHRSVLGLEHRNAYDRAWYDALTGFQYNRLLLRGRRQKALDRMAVRATRQP